MSWGIGNRHAVIGHCPNPGFFFISAMSLSFFVLQDLLKIAPHRIYPGWISLFRLGKDKGGNFGHYHSQGLVLGMEQTAVIPPAAAAFKPCLYGFLYISWPGSRKWTCKSMSPGTGNQALAVNHFDIFPDALGNFRQLSRFRHRLKKSPSLILMSLDPSMFAGINDPDAFNLNLHFLVPPDTR